VVGCLSAASIAIATVVGSSTKAATAPQVLGCLAIGMGAAYACKQGLIYKTTKDNGGAYHGHPATTRKEFEDATIEYLKSGAGGIAGVPLNPMTGIGATVLAKK